MKRSFLHILDRLESYVCRVLLSTFVTLLFVQICARQLFGQSISWIEELSVFMFVWFAYFGASYAARIGAHNRVSFQFNFLPRAKVRWIEAFADLFWIVFNVYFIWLACDFIFNQMNAFWTAQTLGIHLSWIYIALPITFTLMTIRILQVNYLKLVLGVDPKNPDDVDLEKIREHTPESERL